MRLQNLEGQVFSRLTVISRSENISNRPAWLCQCDCGNQKVVSGKKLKSGHTRSCGCLHREQLIERNFKHGKSDTREYKIWCDMKRRCENPDNHAYKYYGGRGITILWPDFESFLKSMGPCPEGYTIERRDNNGPYAGYNCYWADRQTQAQNRRNNRNLTFNGETHCITEWARIIGVHRTTIHDRLAKGLPIEKVLQKTT